jgi:hypothetical protein
MSLLYRIVLEHEFQDAPLEESLSSFFLDVAGAKFTPFCFYVINGFDPLPIEDVSEMFEKLKKSKHSGCVDYDLPFGLITVNFGLSQNHIQISIEDFVFNENEDKINELLWNLQSTLGLKVVDKGWEIEWKVDKTSAG